MVAPKTTGCCQVLARVDVGISAKHLAFWGSWHYPRFFFEEMMQIAAFLMGSKKCDGDFAAGTNFALQAFADFYQREVRA
jgi:hypothetical protein